MGCATEVPNDVWRVPYLRVGDLQANRPQSGHGADGVVGVRVIISNQPDIFDLTATAGGAGGMGAS